MLSGNLLLEISVLLLAGLAGSYLIKFLKMPDVTGYLVIGLLIGPSVLGLISAEGLEGLSTASDIALAFIAFTIGGEFKISYFKRVGALPIVIACFESLGAVALVAAALTVSGAGLPLSLCLGAIAAATAPAATIMVIKQYKARGPVTETLLSVVAIDDATALIAFGIASAVAGSLAAGTHLSVSSAFLMPILEIVISLAAGFGLGIIYTAVLSLFKTKGMRLTATICFILLGAAIAEILGLSALLLCMMLSAAYTNLSKKSADIYDSVDTFVPPIYCMFFVISGADLKLSVLPTVGLIGVIYILVRSAGKWLGAYLGAAVMKADKNVRKYIGPALLPQAGVAIGLSFLAQQNLPQYADKIRAVVLCATLIYELVGPSISKFALQKAGEIQKNA